MIVPAILTGNKSEFQEMLKACKQFTDFVQVDIMDGAFVPSRSIGIDDLAGLCSPLRIEAHLMVEEPVEWIDAFKKLGAKRIIFHYEIKADRKRCIKEIRQAGLGVGLAVNPDTKIEQFSSLVDTVDEVLFMSVVPGFYGAQFIPGVLDKVKKFKELFPKTLTGIDGGIKLTNVSAARILGIDYICVGSAILKADSPAEAFREFSKE